MATTSIVLTRGSFYSPRKALKIFPGACPVTDRRFNICFIGLNMHFGFENLKKNCLFHKAIGPLTKYRIMSVTRKKYSKKRPPLVASQ